MVRTNGEHIGQGYLQMSRRWHRTSFVLAAEIDGLGKAGSLWLLYNFHPGPLSSTLQRYHMFDLYRISRPGNYVQTQVFQLFCGDEGWHQRTINNRKGHLGLVGIDFVCGLRPVHYVKVVQQESTGHFRHATSVMRYLFGHSDGDPVSGPVWVCRGYAYHDPTDCPALVTENGRRVCPMSFSSATGEQEVRAIYL